MRKVFASLLILLMAVLFNGCFLFMGTGFIVTKVVDSITGEPLEGVVVNIGDEERITDEEGLTKSIRKDAGEHTLTFAKEQYATHEETVDLGRGADIVVEVTMDWAEGAGVFSGYVTNARGGVGIDGAKISGEGIASGYTDDSGFFEVEAWAEYTSNLFIEKDNRGTVKIQDTKIAMDEELTFAMPSRDRFKAELSSNPLTINVEGIEPGATVSGEVVLSVSVEGDNPLYSLYGYYSGDTMGFYSDMWMETEEGMALFDSTAYPNGEAYLSFYAYDLAGNLTIHEIPVNIDNDTWHEGEPGPVEHFMAYSMTWGMNPGFYMETREDRFAEFDLDGDPQTILLPTGEEFDLTEAPTDSALYTVITGFGAENATGYEIHRSFDGENFELLAHVLEDIFFDTCPLLEAGKETFYKVVPYNSYGQGEASAILPLTPLPAFNVYLEEPADGSGDVELQPTFSWNHNGEFAEETMVFHDIHLFEATAWMIWEEEILNEESIELPFELEPGVTYTWDIFESVAQEIYYNDMDGMSYALSFAGERDGSKNGEFIFTTIRD